jgi:protein TonB
MYTNWDSCLDSGRNELLFEKRNKQYGAYVIRRDYSRNVLLAFLLTSSFLIGLVAIEFIRSGMAPPPTVGFINKPEGEIEFTEFVVPPIDLPKEDIETEIKPAATDELVNPIVVKELPIETILPAPTGSTANPGLGTPGGEPGPVNLAGPTGIVIPEVIPEKKKPVKIAEFMPKFKSGDAGLLKFLQGEIRYPEKARANNIEGTVYVSFVIDEDGKVTDVKLLQGIFSDCDKEALKAVLSMPDWIPGSQNGENVAVEMSLPVKFRLK